MPDIISIATQNPVTLKPIDKVSDAVEIMAKRGFRRIPVIWEDKLVGIITATDIIRILNESMTSKKGLGILEDEIQHYMNTELVYVYRDDELGLAVQAMFRNNLGSLPIVSSRDGTLAGIVTERDLVKAFTKNSFADADLSEFITKVPITKPFKTTTIKEIISTMVEHGIRRLFLMNKKSIEGVVTASDILRYVSDQYLRQNDLTVEIYDEMATKIATTTVDTVNINSSVADVAQLLVKKGMGGVPVLDDDGNLVGVFTERDILKLVGTYNLI